VLPQGLIGCGRCTGELTPGREQERPAPGSRGHGPGPIEVPAGLLEGGEERLGLVEPPKGHERLDLIRDDPEVGGLVNTHRVLELDGPGQIRMCLRGVVQGKLQEPQDRQVRDQGEDLVGRFSDAQPFEGFQPLDELTSYRVYGRALEFDPRWPWRPVFPCLCVQDSPDSPCPCPPRVWWLRSDMIVAEGKANRKDHQGNELEYFDVRVDSKIVVETMHSVSAELLRTRLWTRDGLMRLTFPGAARREVEVT
jgi:hypothetical protein